MHDPHNLPLKMYIEQHITITLTRVHNQRTRIR